MNYQAVGLGLVMVGLAVLLASSIVAIQQFRSRPKLGDEVEDYLNDVWRERNRRDA